MSDSLATELAARMPWLHAKQDSWWEVTGSENAKHTFDHCLARVLPRYVTGTQMPIFEILIYGQPIVVPASSITSATELMLVLANEPRTAYYDDDQESLDSALAAS